MHPRGFFPALLLAGCAPARPVHAPSEAAPVATPARDAAPSATKAAPDVGDRAQFWEEPPALGAVACRFEAGDRTTKLRVHPDHPPTFAATGASTFSFERGDRDRAGVRVTGKGWSVTGFARRGDVGLFAKGATLRGVVVPHPTSTLAWSGGGEGRVRVDVAVEDFVLDAAGPKEKGVVSDDVACGALALEPPEVERETREQGSPATLAEGEIPIRPSTDAAVVGHFDLESARRVTLLERRASMAKIALRGEHATVVGWVDDVHVGPGVGGRLGESRRARPPRVHLGRHRDARLTCREAVPLFVESLGKWAKVGRVEPGGELVTWPDHSGLVTVQIDGLSDGHWGATAADLGSCRR